MVSPDVKKVGLDTGTAEGAVWGRLELLSKRDFTRFFDSEEMLADCVIRLSLHRPPEEAGGGKGEEGRSRSPPVNGVASCRGDGELEVVREVHAHAIVLASRSRCVPASPHQHGCAGGVYTNWRILHVYGHQGALPAAAGHCFVGSDAYGHLLAW